MEPVVVEMWSDVVCPFCWIGKRHYEEAVRRLGAPNGFRLVQRAFELNPAAGAPMPVYDYLAKKYGGGPEWGRAMTRRVAAMGANAGLTFDFDRALAVNTFDAHRVVRLATERGLGDAVVERLMRAHFAEGADVSDRATLARLAVEAGLDAASVEETLRSDAYAKEVRADEAKAGEIGVGGVPFFVVDGRYAVYGAQPVEHFASVLAKALDARAT
jgi:predicted DsbA family dithiol-disulfide isomerase